MIGAYLLQRFSNELALHLRYLDCHLMSVLIRCLDRYQPSLSRLPHYHQIECHIIFGFVSDLHAIVGDFLFHAQIIASDHYNRFT